MGDPVENIRDNLRCVTSQHRQDYRESVWGRNRIVNDAAHIEKVSPEEFEVLCAKLRRKCKVTREDLSAVKQALFHNDEYIALFFSIDGALQSVIRELSGRRGMRQLEAACCCCNLALGNPKCTLRLTKAAAPYLMALLDGISIASVDVCVWAIGNLASGGLACWQILHSQGALYRLLQLLRISDDKLTLSLMYTLTHYVSTGLDKMLPEELAQIATQTHHHLESQPASYWLMFLLSFPSASADVLLDNHLVSRGCHLLADLATGSCDANQGLLRVTALLRMVGNLVAQTDEVGAVELLSLPVMDFLKLLLTSSYLHVQKECLWVLANLWGHPSEAVRNACNKHQDIEHEMLNTFRKIESV